MFTGLVEALGTVRSVTPEDESQRFAIEVPESFLENDTPYKRIGDSVAINGCCLTVIGTRETWWEFQAGAETLERTNLGRLVVGEPVNLERALPAGGRFGGHIVQGHIDGVATISAMDAQGEFADYWFDASERLTAQMVEKGSVAVDGVSLTLVRVEPTRFQIMLIPHTLAVTTLGRRRFGELVNIETDVLAKYVQKLLAAGLHPAG